jgi:hypothetical protein
VGYVMILVDWWNETLDQFQLDFLGFLQVN